MDNENGTELRPRPVHEIRLGRIKAAIWANETEYGTRHNVTISRLYKDGDSWRRSESFGREDLPLVAKVADRAHTWIYEHGKDAADTSTLPLLSEGKEDSRDRCTV